MASFDGTIKISNLDLTCPACGSRKIYTSTLALNNFFCVDCHYTWGPTKIGENKTVKKETPTMQVTYNGFTGELVKLEKEIGMLGMTDDGKMYSRVSYTLSIYDREKQVTHSFTGVKLEDMKFMGGAVSFGG